MVVGERERERTYLARHYLMLRVMELRERVSTFTALKSAMEVTQKEIIMARKQKGAGPF